MKEDYDNDKGAAKDEDLVISYLLQLFDTYCL